MHQSRMDYIFCTWWTCQWTILAYWLWRECCVQRKQSKNYDIDFLLGRYVITRSVSIYCSLFVNMSINMSMLCVCIPLIYMLYDFLSTFSPWTLFFHFIRVSSSLGTHSNWFGMPAMSLQLTQNRLNFHSVQRIISLQFKLTSFSNLRHNKFETKVIANSHQLKMKQSTEKKIIQLNNNNNE